MGPTRFSYHFRGERVTCISLKTNLSCLKFLMIAIFNGQLYYIFWKLKRWKIAPCENQTLQRK